MIKVLGSYKERGFEFFYMFVMVIYMAQMTKGTSRMVGSLSGNPIPFLIPILLTIILLVRNKVSFYNKNLGVVLLLTTLWSACIIVKQRLFNVQELSYLFFLYYAIVIAFIHCQVFGEKLMPLYEHIMVIFTMISLPLWLFRVILPSAASSFFHLFPKTGLGYNFLYLFNYTEDYWKSYLIPRNAGCSWEPGRFSIMLVLAICFNLLRNGVKFRNNRNVIWLLLALASTQSTTGYSITLLLYLIFLIKKINVKNVFLIIFCLVPIVYGVFQLDFMGGKIRQQMENTAEGHTQEIFDYGNKTGDTKYISLDRFDAIYFEFQNIIKDPILGYGRNASYSYFSKNISTHFGLTGGLLKIIGQMGIPFSLYLYYILYKSSAVMGEESEVRKRAAMFLAVLLASVSYETFCVPVFTSFWFYSLFAKK